MAKSDPPLRMFGRRLIQEPSAIPLFDDFLRRTKPKRILEYGAGNAGFTLYLGIWSVILGGKVLSVEENDNDNEGFLSQFPSIPIWYENKDFYEVLELCEFFFRSDSPSLFINDGGDREKANAIVLPWMVSDDWIVIHDVGGGGNCMTWDSVKDFAEENQFVIWESEYTSKSVWAMLRKT